MEGRIETFEPALYAETRQSVSVTAPKSRDRARKSTSRDRSMPLLVSGIRSLSRSVLEVTLMKEDGSRLPFIPGQFCNLFIPDGEGVVQRSYSIATCTADPEENRTYKIAVAPVSGGAATRFLFGLEVGDTVHASRPCGRLILPKEDAGRYVLVGTGTGVAPYRAMLPALLSRSVRSRFQTTLLMGVRTREELFYADEFRSIARRHPWFRFIACYSREEPQGLQADERSGRVQAVRDELALDTERDRVYLCGHPGMIDDWTHTLKDEGFTGRNLVREKYVSAKSKKR